MIVKRFSLVFSMVCLLSTLAMGQDKGVGTPKLWIMSTTHVFGSVKAGTPLKFSFVVKNEGTTDLVIKSVAPSCGCTTSDFDKVVAPGKEGKITLAIERTEHYSGQTQKYATVSTNDPNQPTFGLTLQAFFISDNNPGATPPVTVAAPTRRIGPFAASPNDRWITATIRGQSTTSLITFINNQPAPTHITRVDPGGPNFTATLFTIEDGKRYELSLATNPALQPGKYTQTAIVYTDSKESPQIPISMEANVLPLVIAVPATVTLPRMVLDSDFSKVFIPIITVRKVRQSGLRVKDVSVDLPFLSVELLPPTDDVYQVRLTLDKSKISAPGEFHGKIRIQTNDPETPLIEVPVNCAFI